jgi:hypothetical protein
MGESEKAKIAGLLAGLAVALLRQARGRRTARAPGGGNG